MSSVHLIRPDTSELASVQPALIEVYTEIFTELPYSNANDSAADFAERLSADLTHPGGALVVARQDDNVIGFSYGFPLQPGSLWWANVEPPLSPQDSTETGTRTFAIIEMHVRRRWRRQGVATALHRRLLSGRAETRATLGVRESATTAQMVYHRWGYHPIGRENVPPAGWFLVMLRQLPQGGGPR